MSRHAAIEQDFADGTYTFRLSIDGIEELEAKLDRGLFVIADRLRNRSCKISEIREILRIGLNGGGKSPVDALALVRRYVDERPIEENRDVAYAVALAGLMRVHGDQVAGEAPDGPGEGQAAETDDTTSPPSEARR